MSQRVETAVIPVAGLGTRFLPISKGIAKELLPVIDKPVIQYIIEELVASGIQRIVFVVSAHKRSVAEYFERDIALESFLLSKGKEKELATIRHLHAMAEFYTVEQHEPLGLGHAVLQAREVVGEHPFIVCGGDDIVDGDTPAAQELIRVYEEYQASVVGIVRVPQEQVQRYGIVAPQQDILGSTFPIADIIEKPQPEHAPSTYAVGGRWLLTPRIFDALAHMTPGVGGEIQLTDALRDVVAHEPMYAHAYSGIYRDCGNKTEYIKAIISYAVHHPEIKEDIIQFIRSM